MKRFHVHVAVNDLNKSIAFYSAMFGEEPAVVKADYAKWMLDDPRVNFAISNRGHAPGINHLGLQAEDDAELEAIYANLQKADTNVLPEKGVNCCYAKSDKYWVTDPQGIAWESFRSLGSVPMYGEEHQAVRGPRGVAQATDCCVPRAEAQPTTKGTTCCGSDD